MIPILALACAVRSSNLARCTWFFFCPLDKIFQSKKLIVFSFFTLNYMQCFLILFVFDFRRYIKAIIYIAAASSWWHATNFLKCGIKLLVLKLHYYFRLKYKTNKFSIELHVESYYILALSTTEDFSEMASWFYCFEFSTRLSVPNLEGDPIATIVWV